MFLPGHLTVACICNSLFTPLSSVQNSKLSEGKNQGYLCLSPMPSLWHTQVDSKKHTPEAAGLWRSWDTEQLSNVCLTFVPGQPWCEQDSSH